LLEAQTIAPRPAMPKSIAESPDIAGRLP